jgi:hypothetical protein
MDLFQLIVTLIINQVLCKANQHNKYLQFKQKKDQAYLNKHKNIIQMDII